MSKYIKTLITPLVETRVKNVKIINYLREEAKLEEESMPWAAQLNRFRWYYRATKINEIGVKVKSTYIEWIDKNKLNEENPDNLFVIDYKLGPKEFIFVLSSLTLLQNAISEDQYVEGYACVDSTFKLMNCKFPLAIFSRRDKAKKHRVIAFAILSAETKENYSFTLNAIHDSILKELNLNWRVKVNYFYFFHLYLIMVSLV